MLTYIPAFISQDIFTKVSLLGYLYPLLLVTNCVFVIIWIFLKPRHILLPLIAIIIRFDYITRLVNINSYDEGGVLKVLTYNVHDFVHGNENDNFLGTVTLQDSILNYISNSQAHILCLQDYDVNITWEKGFHKFLTDSLGYTHFYFYYVGDEYVSNCCIYSKFPITDAGSAMENDSKRHYLLYSDIRTPWQTVRIYNFHLISYMLGDKEKSAYKSILNGNITNEASKSLISKITTANKIRAKQIKQIIPEIEKQQKPVIVCGDFNDHPFSNTYHRFSKILSDSFTKKGNGIGKTYNGIFPAYRIDYIWYDKSRLECINYKCDYKDFSDHYPVTATFNIKKQ